MERLNLLLLFSLGRSGSTFLARTIAENSEYVNAGENRYFWQELVKQPREEHAAEIARFFAVKTGERTRILDKTPELYRYIEQIDFGHHCTQYVELLRDPEAIASSRRNFRSAVLKPSRLKIRIRDYRRDYGRRWLVPILQRWFLLPAALGLAKGRAFSTASSGVGAGEERKAFDLQMQRLKATGEVITIDYDDFEKTVGGLTEIGLSDAAVERVKQGYRG